MSTFNAEQMKTSEKMSDLVMEHVSQFIARDFLDAYEKAGAKNSKEFVPSEFDDKIYKKITRIAKKNTGHSLKTLRLAIFLFAALTGALCVLFTAAVLMHDGLRSEIISIIQQFIF